MWLNGGLYPNYLLIKGSANIIRYLNSIQINGLPKIFFQKHIRKYSDEYFRSEYIRNNRIINQIVDCSQITNLYGINSIAINPEYRKKKFSKLSIISDEKKIIIAVDFDETHLTKKNNPAFCHDLKIVQSTLNKMSIDLPPNKIV